jgi:hypothetical protein
MHSALVIFLSLAYAQLVAAADVIPVSTGSWEIKYVIKMAAGEPMGSPPQTRCLTEADLVNPEWVFSTQDSRQLAPQFQPKITDLKIAGNQVSYSVRPPNLPEAKVSGVAEATRFRVERTVAGFPAVTTIEGKRLGDCK